MLQRNFLLTKIVRDRGVGNHDFPSKLFCLTVPNHFIGEPFCFRKFRVSKKFMHKRGISPFSKENLLSHSTEKLCRGTVLCFRKILVSEKIMDKREGGGREYHNFLSKFFCLSAEKFRRETLLCCGSENFR